MSNTNPPEFKMTLGSVDFSAEKMHQRVVEIQVEQVADGPDYFKVTLDNGDDSLNGKIKEGDSVSIDLGYANEGTQHVFDGLVTGVESFRREYRRQMLVVKGFDPMHKLTRGRKQRSWENVKDSDVASEVISQAGLSPDCEDSEIVHPYISQNNVTNLAFLYERARRVGFIVDYYDGKVHFKKKDLQSQQDLIWDDSNMSGGGGRLLKRCQFSTSTMNVVDKVVVRSWDPKTRKEIVGSSDEVHGDTMGGQKTGSAWAPSSTLQVSDQPVRSAAEASKLAYSILNERAGSFMSGNGSSEGDPKIKAGQAISVKKMGADFDGQYFVSRANHRLKIGAGAGNGYETEFEIERSGR